jgi:NitT/TauT family transport system ATP-binding protein
MTAVTVRNVWKSYGGQNVLERVNLTLPAHSFCAIVGASGCGKTTFLRMLLSQEQPTRGEILIDGEPIAGEPGPDRGVVFQRYSVFPHLTAVENVALSLEFKASRFLGRLFGKAKRTALEQGREMLEAVGLREAGDKYPAELSGGMQQRLAIAQALICRPRILLLDEPFGALDVGTKAQMHELLLRLWRESDMTVFMVTHDIQEGFDLATRVAVFDKWRTDPQAPDAYGATITYDVPLDRAERQAGHPPDIEISEKDDAGEQA